MIRLYLKKFVRLILPDGFWVLHMLFVRMIEFQFLALFPLDHLPHLDVSCLILFFVLICCIRLLSDWSFRPYHHMTYNCYFVASCLLLLWYNWSLCRLFYAAIRRDSVTLLRVPFLRNLQVFSSEISFAVAWNVRTVVLFPFLFSSYFCSVDTCVVCIVSGGCNQSFSRVFSYSLLIDVSIHWCYLEGRQVLFLLLFLAHTVCLRHLCDVRPNVSSLAFFFFGLFVGVLLWSTL